MLGPRITFIILFIVLSVPYVVFGDVKINEIGIDKTPQTIELINTASVSADISNWFIDDSGGTTYYTIPQNTTLYPNSCLVFENDFNLNKSSADTARLFYAIAPPTAAEAVLIDSYPFKSGPGAGFSFIRTPDGGADWTTAISSFGQWNSARTSCVVVPSITSSPSPSPTPTATPTPSDIPQTSPTAPAPQNYDNILINEVYPYPGADEKEWVELYNGNEFDVSLTKWFLDDMEDAGGTPKQFSVAIPSHGYTVVELQSPLFNNEGDSVRLLNQDKTEKDGLEYIKAQKGKSFGRTSFESGQLCMQEPTKGTTNGACLINSSNQVIRSAVILPSGTLPSPVREYQSSTVRQQPIVHDTNNPPQPEVLGETAPIPSPESVSHHSQTSPVPYMSLVSLSYSFLTIVSILIKIKNGFAT